MGRLREDEEAGTDSEEGEDEPFAPQQPVLDEATAVDEQDDELDFAWSSQPTELFVQSSPSIPPYLAGTLGEEQAQSHDLELSFGGWEDSLPAAQAAVPEYYEQQDPAPWEAEVEPEPEAPTPFRAIPRPVHAVEHHLPPTPRLFEDDAFLDAATIAEEHEAHPRPARFQPPKVNMPSLPQVHAGAALRGVVSWASATGRALIPSGRPSLSLPSLPVPRLNGRPLSMPQLAGHTLPLRLVIVAALGLVVLLLALSVATMAGSTKKQANDTLLVAAQQLETEANQPGLTDAERREKLEGALAKAQQALAADPTSDEADLLVGKLQTDLDKIDGITRLSGVKLLFTLEPTAQDATGADTGTAQAAAPISGTLPVQDVVVQSNDLYVLDRTTNRVYRCQVATQGCTPILSGGDTAGSEKVGVIQHITLRIGAPVVVDDRMVSYALDTSNGSWQAEPLGDAASLRKPKDIGTYDGNLYLLDAKPGQITKYEAGQYGSPPADWVRADAATKPLDNPVAMAIDGAIYILLADGKIAVMQGGQIAQTITPSVPGATTPATDLFTSTDVHDIYVLRAGEGLVTRVSKEGKTAGSFKAPAGMNLDRLSGFSVDESRGKVYLVVGQDVYEGAFPSVVAPQTQGTGSDSNVVVPSFEDHLAPAAEGEAVNKDAAPTGDVSNEPAARPTVEP
jgi:hypothetical protein